MKPNQYQNGGSNDKNRRLLYWMQRLHNKTYSISQQINEKNKQVRC